MGSKVPSRFQFFQNGTFEPVHDIAKVILLKRYENDNKKKYL